MSNQFDSTWKLHSRDVFSNLESIDENQTTSYTNQSSLLCSFCNTYFSPSVAIREHLLLCGNKTDQCPKCQKFIRRAIFAYHYENDCANIDESNDLVSTISTGFDPSPSASHMSIPLLSSSTSHIKNTEDKQRHPAQIVHKNQMIQDEDFSTLRQCSFCGQNCERADLKRHQEKCLQNSSRRMASSEQEWRDSSNQNRDRSLVARSYPSNLQDQIPCQYCNDNELFDLKQLNDHMNTYHQPNDQSLSQCIKRQCIISTVPCEYCEMQCSLDDLNIHQMDCPQNPRNIAYHESKTLKPHLSSTN